MAYSEIGEAALRAESIERTVKKFADPMYKLKQLVMTPKSSAWQESYYQESKTVLPAGSGIARMAAFPNASPTWEKASAYMRKFGLETEVSIEDVLMNNIDVIGRAQWKIAQAITSSVDTYLWKTLSQDMTPTTINTFAAQATWDHATRTDRHPQDDIGKGIEYLAADNYTADTLLVNNYDYRLLVTNDDILDAFSPTTNVMANGNMGTILGLNTIVANVVSSDNAMILQSKICGTYRIAKPLTIVKEVVEGIKHTIRAYEIGTAFITDPEAICLITNTNV